MTHRIGVGLVLGVFSVALLGCGGGGASDQIVRVSRQNNSGTYAYFREVVLGEDREYKLGSIDQSGSKDVVELVSKTPMAIGYSGMGYATPEVKMLKVAASEGGAGVPPTVATALDKTYPLARPLYIYLLGEPSGEIKHYLDWIKSQEGQNVVAEIGYVPIAAVEPPADQQSPEAATIKVTGSDTMVNLAAAWAEKYRAKHPNVDIQVNGGGSGVGIASLIDGTVDLADASREMKPQEKEKAEANSGKTVTEIVVALDALAVYVHKDNPLDTISIHDLAEIYGEGGTITRWSQVKGWPTDVN